MALLVAFLAAQADEGIPTVEDERTLRRKIAELRLEQERTNRELREALEREDREGARRHAGTYRSLQSEVERLERRLGDLPAGPSRPTPWYLSFNLVARGLLTHWDDDLDLEDGAGWGAGLSLRDFLFFEYHRWDTQDERGEDDASAASYEIGFTYEIGLAEEKTSAFLVGMAAGVIRFSGEAPGLESDVGPVLTFRPEWRYYVSPHLRFTAGADVDLARSDFNQRHTHTLHTFSLLLSIEWAF